ncbi:MAG: hypothetical protein ABJQ29_01480 [Luteolibacter sp.]
MSLRVQLQDSQGSGCRIDARTATLSACHAILQTGQGNFLSFPSGELEVIQTGGSRYFGVGEGFASIGEGGLCLVTDRYVEVASPNDVHSLPVSSSVLACAVCGKVLTDTCNSIVVNETPVSLCCPHCVDTFRRATRIVRQAYLSGASESETQ